MPSNQQIFYPLTRIWFVIVTFIVLFPLAFHLPSHLTLPSMLLLIWRFIAEWRLYPPPPPYIKITITLFTALSIYLSFNTLVGYEAGSALLAMLMILKLFEIRGHRDGIILISIGYFILAIHFLFNQSIFMGGYLVVSTLILTLSLMLIFHQPHKIADIALALRQTSTIFLQTLPLVILLFLFFPRISGPLWGMPQPSTTATTGLSDQLNFGSISDLVDSTAIAFRVEFVDQTTPPDLHHLYWRGPVLVSTDGRRWFRSDSPFFTRFQSSSLDLSEPDSVLQLVQNITLEPSRGNWLPVLDWPTQISSPGAYLHPVTLNAIQRNSISHRIIYSATSAIDFSVDNSHYLDKSDFIRHTALPSGLNPQSHRLAQEIWQRSSDSTSYINAVLAHFNQLPFYYTRQPSLLLSKDAVDEFLFSSRQGFCEHYAVAFTTLMRAAGLPARVVTGYQGGIWNSVGNYLTIRQSDAHAWSEVWIDELQQWQRVDPTTAIPASRVLSPLDLQRINRDPSITMDLPSFLSSPIMALNQYWDNLNLNWQKWIIGFNTSRQQQFLNSIGLSSFNFQFLFITITILILLAVTILWIIIYHFQQKSLQPTPVQRIYLRFVKKMTKVGIPPMLNEGCSSYLERIQIQRSDLYSEVAEICRLYHLLRYAPHPSSSHSSLLQLFDHKIVTFRPSISHHHKP
jgi:protein-glutamine gamma-glutamyltransferase